MVFMFSSPVGFAAMPYQEHFDLVAQSVANISLTLKKVPGTKKNLNKVSHALHYCGPSLTADQMEYREEEFWKGSALVLEDENCQPVYVHADDLRSGGLSQVDFVVCHSPVAAGIFVEAGVRHVICVEGDPTPFLSTFYDQVW